MAAASFSHIAPVTINGNGTFTPNSPVPQNISVNTGADETLSSGEFFTLNGDEFFDTAGSVSYIGYTANGGIIYQAGNGNYYYVTNNPPFIFQNVSYSTNNLVVCFLAGTEISTPNGPCPIDVLRIGDLILTASGETRPVRWVGRQEVVTLFADRLRNFPIRIQAGALGEQRPVRDLFISPAHALMIDGLLVQAASLINGTTIQQIQNPGERFTYFHIELEDHALVLAEGVAAETFVDNVTRSRFDNYADYVARYGEAPLATDELEVPRVKSPRQLPAAIKTRLAARAALLLQQGEAA